MATEYEGVKWGDTTFGTPGGTVTYGFATPSYSGAYTYTAELDAAYQALVEDAFQRWSTYADIQFVFTYDVAAVDIVLGWDTIDGDGGTAGEAYYQFYQSGELISSEIIFDEAEDWTLTGSGPGASFYAVALHEIGHAIGLDHTSDADSIMYPTTIADDLSATDIAGIQALYGAAGTGGGDGAFFGNSLDDGGWNHGWHRSGGWSLGWHMEAGWDRGWYLDGSGWHDGWFFHQGWENGWYGTGAWHVGWYYDYGGYGWGGANTGWQDYGWDGGEFGHEGWSGPPPASAPAWVHGDSIDVGGWNYGWYEYGGWNWGWHIESGWDLGWFEGAAGWDYGWFMHEGWEYGWYGTGSWRYGWYYDYGGGSFGWGWNVGWQDYGWSGGWTGHESWY